MSIKIFCMKKVENFSCRDGTKWIHALVNITAIITIMIDARITTRKSVPVY